MTGVDVQESDSELERVRADRERYRAALYAVMDQLGSPDRRTNAYKALEIARHAVYGTGPRLRCFHASGMWCRLRSVKEEGA